MLSTAPARGAPHGVEGDPWSSLNAEQRAAVEHGIGSVDPGEAGPLLVVAGAGSGKTLTLTSRLARLITAGADPQRILLLTFSRRAANDMSRRAAAAVAQALGLPASSAPLLPWCGTYHGLAARLLRDVAEHVGLPRAFSILDRGDAEDLMGIVRHDLNLDATSGAARFPLKGTCLAIYSRTVNADAPLGAILATAFPWCAAHEVELKRLFGAYVAEKQRQAVLDFDDLLVYWRAALEAPVLGEHLRSRFDHVLVDEYQDTNTLQAAIVRLLSPQGRGLTVVGDDAQAIYAFRGADVAHILGFAAQFDPPARTIALERNYRSVQPILDASNAVIALAARRFAKRLWTDRAASARPQLVTVEDDAAQARWVVDRVLSHREDGLALRSQAVLFRSAHHSSALELELARRNVPFVKFGGLQFLEAAHVKDVISVLRWADNPRHRLAGLRMLRLVPGFGHATVMRLLDAIDAGADPWQVVERFEAPARARAEWAALREVLTALNGDPRWPDDLERVRRWYAPHLERLHDDARVREADLAQLVRIAAAASSRRQFVSDLAIDPPAATSDEAGDPLLDDDYLVLSTIHSAKGLEWKAVFVLNAVDGCIPSDMATGSNADIDEERRLLYVALTRARHYLHVLVPQRFYVTHQAGRGDRHLYASLTRFIPPEVGAFFDHESPAPPARNLSSHASGIPPTGVDIAARLRNAWS